MSLDPGLTDEEARDLLDHLGDAGPTAEGLDEIAQLKWLWSAVLGTYLLEPAEDASIIRPGRTVAAQRDADDEQALDVWLGVVADLLIRWAESAGPDLGATTVLLHLFATRTAASRDDLAALPDAGPPAALERDLAWMSDAGLIEDHGSRITVTALGTYVGRDMIEEALGQPIPVVGWYGDGTAAGFLRYVRAHSSEELAGRLASRDVESAAAQIAEALAWVSPTSRLRGMQLLIDDLGAAGRLALDSLHGDSRLAALAQMLLSERDEPYEATPSQSDVSWTLVDVGAAGIELMGPSLDALAALGAVDVAPVEFIELISELGESDHPWTGRVLTTIADLHSDPQVVRAARAELRRHRGADARPGERGRKPRKPKKAGKRAGAGRRSAPERSGGARSAVRQVFAWAPGRRAGRLTRPHGAGPAGAVASVV